MIKDKRKAYKLLQPVPFLPTDLSKHLSELIVTVNIMDIN